MVSNCLSLCCVMDIEPSIDRAGTKPERRVGGPLVGGDELRGAAVSGTCLRELGQAYSLAVAL
jgi:hypothetical protein